MIASKLPSLRARVLFLPLLLSFVKKKILVFNETSKSNMTIQNKKTMASKRVHFDWPCTALVVRLTRPFLLLSFHTWISLQYWVLLIRKENKKRKEKSTTHCSQKKWRKERTKILNGNNYKTRYCFVGGSF